MPAAWANLTGYKFVEVVHKSSAFLQGPQTEAECTQKLAKACQAGQHLCVQLLNYTKSGKPFINALELFPLRDANGALTHFCGVLTGKPAPEGIKPLERISTKAVAEPPLLPLPMPPPPPPLPALSQIQRMPRVDTSSASSSTAKQQGQQASSQFRTQQPMLLVQQQRQQMLQQQMQMQMLQQHNQRVEGVRGRGGAAGQSHEEQGAGQGNSAGVQRPHRPKRQRSERVRLGDALNNASDAVVLTQPQPPYKITHVNEPWTIMCGYTQEEVEGHTNAILQGPETDSAIVEDMMRSVGQGKTASATLVNYKKDGKRFVNQLQVVPVYNEEDEVEQFMAMLHEVDCGTV